MCSAPAVARVSLGSDHSALLSAPRRALRASGNCAPRHQISDPRVLNQQQQSVPPQRAACEPQRSNSGSARGPELGQIGFEERLVPRVERKDTDEAIVERHGDTTRSHGLSPRTRRCGSRNCVAVSRSKPFQLDTAEAQRVDRLRRLRARPGPGRALIGRVEQGESPCACSVAAQPLGLACMIQPKAKPASSRASGLSPVSAR
jgi:hypothetical protein